MAEAQVLTDGNLAWAVALALRDSSLYGALGWPVPAFKALSSTNKAFRGALATQPVYLTLPGKGMPDAEQLQNLADSTLNLKTVEWRHPNLHALDTLNTLSQRKTCDALTCLRGLLVDTETGWQAAELLPCLPALRTLHLLGHPALDGRPTVFSSSWVAGLSNLEYLSLRGFELRELTHLPQGLKHLDLSGSHVSFEQALYLPKASKLESLAKPHGAGGHWRFEE